MATPELTDDQVFEAAFNQIADADKKDQILTPEQFGALTPEKTPEQLAADAKAETEAAASAEAAKVAAATGIKSPEEIAAANEAKRVADETAAAAAAPAVEKPDPLLERLGKIVRRDEQAEAAAAAKAEADRIAAESAKTAIPGLTAAEVDRLNAFDKEFPDVEAAQSIRRKHEYGVLTQHIFKEVTGYVGAKFDEIRPLLEAISHISERTYLGDLKAAIPDYDKTPFDKLEAWVNEQPGYLKTAMTNVIKTGTIEEAKHLIDSFQKATGLVPTKTDPEATAAATAADVARAKAAKALAPVNSKRSGTVAAEAPADFGGAFAEFSKMFTDEDKASRF